MRHILRRSYCFFILLLSLGAVQAQTTQEPFEAGTKAVYPLGTVTLATGDWDFADALLGTDVADHKNGTQAVRLEQTGQLTMDFYLPTGASLVTVQHAVYGDDASSAWELWAQSQSCSCNNWSKVGPTVLTTSATLQTAAFNVNLPGSVRFQLRKVSGGAARLNFDDFTVTPFGQAPPVVDNDNLTLGNPSNAVVDINSPDNYKLVKTQYVVGYNASQGKPNWVSWHLDLSNRGTSDRQNNFRPDSSLPASFYHVQLTDYVGTGFDRGHNCPSADRTNTVPDNSATFLMSNMMPQAPNNNQKTWADLENYTRSFLTSGFEAYVICGSYGTGGFSGPVAPSTVGTYQTTIAAGHVTVPNRTWKVVVLLPVGNNDIARISANTRIIAVDMPNDNGLNLDWGVYRTSIDTIEAAVSATGLSLDLLSNVPVAVQNVIEAKVDTGGTTMHP